MNAVHVIALVPADDPIAVPILVDFQTYEYYQLPRIDTSDLENSTRTFMNTILDLPIKVGQTVIVVTSADQILEEHVISVTMLRRLQDSITFIIARSGKKVSIPYLPNLRQKEYPTNINYSYSCGGCSGNCSSCK